MQQWDGAKWVKVSDAMTPNSDKVQPLIDEAAKNYAEKNAGWPQRTEACDNKSVSPFPPCGGGSGRGVHRGTSVVFTPTLPSPIKGEGARPQSCER